MKLLVTGGTGEVGWVVVEDLVKKVGAEEIGVSVGDGEKAGDLKESGVDVGEGEFSEGERVKGGFEGIEGVVMI